MTAKPTIAFRVASRPVDGGGHMRRCLALAKEISLETEVLFVLDHDGEAWQSAVVQEGYGCALVDDFGDQSCAACILDGYHFTEADFRFWRGKSRKLVRICDDQIAEGFWRESDFIIYPARPDQALIAKAFFVDDERQTPGQAKSILISFGLRDSVNATAQAVRACEQAQAQTALDQVTVVLGHAAPHRAEIEGVLATSMPFDARLLIDADDMVGLMRQADLAIGAGGVSALERAAMGLPSVTITIADNQREGAKRLHAAGASLYLGGHEDVDIALLADTIAAMANDADRRRVMTSRGRQAVNRQGIVQVTRRILNLLH